MRWIVHQASTESVDSVAREIGVLSIIVSILTKRGVTEVAEMEAFLNPRLRSLSDPFAVGGLLPIVERLIEVIERREQVLVVGDYDVDGVTSTALLVDVLQRFDVPVQYVIPRRLEEGYGLSQEVIDRGLAEINPQLLIALDCGTNSHEECAYLAERGIDVVVVDHHQSTTADLPAAVLLMNPHVCDCADAQWRNLCTVGLVFKLVHGLIKQLRMLGCKRAGSIDIREYLDLVALGTVADLVPLTRENRTLVSHGLRGLTRQQRPGLAALMRVSGITPGQQVLPSDVSFRLAPRINASGRLADATLPVQLLLSKDTTLCETLAEQLEMMNRERQEIERGVYEEAEAYVHRKLSGRTGLLLYNEDWHTGVVGIVAGKLARTFNRPCVVLGREGEVVKGSGRSVRGINLVDILKLCDEYLVAWGGHPMAVGVTASEDQLDELADTFDRAVTDLCRGKLPEEELHISGWVDPEDMAESFFAQIDKLHPFGQSNAEPVFALPGVMLAQSPELFGNGNFRFSIPRVSGPPISGVAWRMADQLPPCETRIDVAVKARWNEWNGRRIPQVELIDWRYA